MGTSTLALHGKESPGCCDPGTCDQWNITPEPRSERLRVWTGCVSRDEGVCALSRVLSEYAMRPVSKCSSVDTAGMAVVTGQPSTRGARCARTFELGGIAKRECGSASRTYRRFVPA